MGVHANPVELKTSIFKQVAQQLRGPSIEMMVNIVRVIVALGTPVIKRNLDYKLTVRLQNRANAPQLIQWSGGVLKRVVRHNDIDAGGLDLIDRRESLDA